MVDRALGAVESAAGNVAQTTVAAAERAASVAEATAEGATQIAATRRYAANMAAAVYGLILTGAVLAASGTEETAGEILVFLVLTLSLFWAAHVYSELLSEWAASGEFPGARRWAGEMRRQWPMVGACTLPALALLFSVVGPVRTGPAVAVALVICTAELALAGFIAARRGGGGLVAGVVSAAVAFAFGVTLIILKAILH